jgi:hypothetical protein
MEITFFSFFVLEGVSDGHTVPVHARPAELKVVAHEVEMRFRTDENVVGDIEADSAPNVSHKVVAAGVIRATRK